METVAETEVVVVGGGISGCASAYELARAGKDVILVEKGKIAGEASGRNTGGVRQQGRHAATMPMAIEALKIWPNLDEELGYRTEFRRGGDLTVAMDDDEMGVLRAAAVRQNRMGLPCSLVDAAGVRHLVKGISDRAVGGIFVPSDGQANPILATKAFAEAAQDRGARVWIGTEVTGIQVRDGEVVAVDTSRGRVLARCLVLAAGPWTTLLGRLIGITIPIYPSRLQILVTETTGPIFECFLHGNDFSARQAKSGNLHLRGSGPPREFAEGRPILFDKTTTGTTIQRTARCVVELIPAVADLLVLRSWAGILEQTPDRLPIIDRLVNPSNVIVAAGFSGHGFGLGPITGKVVAELVLYGRSTIDLSGLKLDRFDLTSPEAEQFNTWYASPLGSFSGQELLPADTRTCDRW